MNFKEKSSWVMCVSVLFGGLFYAYALTSNLKSGEAIQLKSITISYLLIIILASIIGHIIAALTGLKEAEAPEDERDKIVSIQSNSMSSYVLGFGVISGMILYLVTGNGDVLFHFILASLTLSTIIEYILRIYFYRAIV